MALFTQETASEMGKRSVKSRLARIQAEERIHAEALERYYANLTKPLEPDTYIEKRIARVRLQLNRIDEKLMTEENPQAIDRLAAAAARLSEQERILAGRPLPGSHRPVRAPRSKPGDSPITPE